MKWPGMVAHTCDLSYSRGGDREDHGSMVHGQPGQKVNEIPSQPISPAQWGIPVIPATRQA
jgi:hypothetical protein